MKKFASGVVGCSLFAATVLLACPGGAFAAGPYDGTYHGTLTGGANNAQVCAKGAPVQMTVTDSQLEYNHMGHTTIKTPVAADGSFSGSARNTYTTSRSGVQVQTLSGKISAGTIQAETSVGNSCTYSLSLKRF